MKLVLICNEEKIYDGDVSQVDVETENGVVSILPQHQPYMAKVLGKVSYIPINAGVVSIDISEGFIYTDGMTCFAVVDK